MRHTALAALTLSVGLLLTACSSSDDTSAQSSTTAATQSSSAEHNSAAFPITIDHFRGSTTLEHAPERIVVIDNSYMENVVALGGHVVGVATSNGEKYPDYFTDEQKKMVEDATDIGDLKTPSLEKIAALKPDLILSSDYRSKDYYDDLSKIAPTIFSEKAGTTWEQNTLLTGKALGKEEEAQELLDTINARAEAIGADIRAQGDPGTVSIVRFSPNLRLYNPASFPGSMLAKMGLQQPANQQADPAKPNEIFFEFSPETVGEAEADTILAMAPDPDSDRRQQWEAAANPVLESQLWKDLKGRKVEVNDEVWFLNVSPLAAQNLLDSAAEIWGVDNHRDIDK